jgi:hypothetical protein
MVFLSKFGVLNRPRAEVVQRMLGHASAAMTLDVYADLFDSDLDSVAESVAKMWPREARSHACSPQKSPLSAQTLPQNRCPR